MGTVGSLLSLLSFSISNFCCVALYTFFMTTLPTQRNLLTFFDTVLVLSLTGVVNILVSNLQFVKHEPSPVNFGQQIFYAKRIEKCFLRNPSILDSIAISAFVVILVEFDKYRI